MRIAVIGAGASGLTAAWLLQQRHEVEVFERAAMAGGHVRTLNRNVPCPALPAHVQIENGVLGFHRQTYPRFFRLMEKLNVPMLDDQPSARLYRGTSEYPVTPQTFLRSIDAGNLARKGREVVQLLGMGAAYRRFGSGLASWMNATPATAATGPLLSGNSELRALQRAMLMLAFSTPIAHVDGLPAGLTLPFLAGLREPDWSYVKGGTFRYMEALLNDFDGVLHLNAGVDQVCRSAQHVELRVAGNSSRLFDKVVFATSPGNILGLIQNPTEIEQRCFSPWRDRSFETVAHTGASMYDGFDPVAKTPMDLFVDEDAQRAGYNTSMNHAYRLPESPGFAFAYGLDDRIDLGQVLDRQVHVVPAYSGEAFATRDAIQRTQGQQHCYYVGAWLGNGLHEGAVSSAVDVAVKLGADW